MLEGPRGCARGLAWSASPSRLQPRADGSAVERDRASSDARLRLPFVRQYMPRALASPAQVRGRSPTLLPRPPAWAPAVERAETPFHCYQPKFASVRLHRVDPSLCLDPDLASVRRPEGCPDNADRSAASPVSRCYVSAGRCDQLDPAARPVSDHATSRGPGWCGRMPRQHHALRPVKSDH